VPWYNKSASDLPPILISKPALTGTIGLDTDGSLYLSKHIQEALDNSKSTWGVNMSIGVPSGVSVKASAKANVDSSTPLFVSILADPEKYRDGRGKAGIIWMSIVTVIWPFAVILTLILGLAVAASFCADVVPSCKSQDCQFDGGFTCPCNRAGDTSETICFYLWCCFLFDSCDDLDFCRIGCCSSASHSNHNAGHNVNEVGDASSAPPQSSIINGICQSEIPPFHFSVLLDAVTNRF
jgi:hypothetical protein